MPAWAQIPAAPAVLTEASSKALLLDQAQGWVEVQGAKGLTIERALVQLPYHWDKLHAARSGRADLEIAFELPGEPSEPHAVFLPRVGNRFELWLNGVLISRGASLGTGEQMGDQRADFGKSPRYFAIAPNLLQKSNLFRLRLEADGGRRAGLMPLMIGPEQEVRAAYEQAYQFRTSSSLAVLTLMLVLTAVSASLWLTQLGVSSQQPDQRDPLYAFAALAAATWALRLSDHLMERSLLPWPAWGVITGVALGACLLCLYALLIYIANQQHHAWAQRYLKFVPILVVVSALVSGLTLTLQWPWLLSAWYVLLWLLGASFVSWFVWQTAVRGDANMRVMSAALLLNLAITAADLWRFRVSTVLNDNSWAGMASAAYALAVFFIVIARFRSASAQARDLRNTLEARVAQREAELALSYQKLDALSREQAKSEERTRILRDMHDGVGAHISSAIRQVENQDAQQAEASQASRAELLQTLRDSLDQLKLSIDAMHLPAGDITALLANLRYRLEPRLQRSGIALDWAVQRLSEQPQLDHAALRQLQFMLFEAFSNVLQHSGASQLQLAASEEAGRIRISLTDNGNGFDPSQPSRGLTSMRERAQAIAATVTIDSKEGETKVEISWASVHNALV